jgi:hypothetical protein
MALRLNYCLPYTWTAVHHDGQGSVRGVTDAPGARVERTIYRPYGNWSSDLTAQWSLTTPTESHSYIGERLDADAGLLFLNARYMDPQLAPPRENSPPDCFLTLVDHPARLVGGHQPRRRHQPQSSSGRGSGELE